jgi:hypothetical protein
MNGTFFIHHDGDGTCTGEIIATLDNGSYGLICIVQYDKACDCTNPSPSSPNELIPISDMTARTEEMGALWKFFPNRKARDDWFEWLVGTENTEETTDKVAVATIN